MAENKTGLYVSHLMVALPIEEKERAKAKENLSRIKQDAQLKGDQFFTAATFGHESDAIIMVLATSSKELLGIENSVKASVQVVDSFLSITETSEYATSEEEEQSRVDDLPVSDDEKSKMMNSWRERMAIYEKHKLYPELPPKSMEYICFYPMSKKREGKNNWYVLPFDQRVNYMRDHGALGRKYSGRIIQLITGATGLSDFEWGVSLFSKTLDDIKEIVYEMRFDEASALYGEFGHFTIGQICEPEQL